MFGIRALGLYKIVGAIGLLINAAIKLKVLYFQPFHLFTYIHSSLANALFSLALVVLLFLIREENYRFFTLFNVLIFVDTILVYGTINNFLIHVGLLVALTQIYYRIKLVVREKRDIAEHLLEEE